METLKRTLIKMCSKPMQLIYASVPAGAFPHKFNAFSFHYTTDSAASFSLTQLQKNTTGWIPQWYFGTYASWSFKHWNILKCLKQSFKILKPELLKATSFKKWNETVFQTFCDTYWLSKMLFKNVCINPILKGNVLTII